MSNFAFNPSLKVNGLFWLGLCSMNFAVGKIIKAEYKVAKQRAGS